ncbi:growth-regulating factor 2-like isoform X2 [Macadamia integrifolia]|uniref:growth-regulating factor 2-like isoform X2 n=1 Tax=Macadamia integrifolia TaxID=60698 RepID=UPI001C4F34C2|nr:growth-regulating factor 2-like isoform X2 [Macadamia integrifolia]
MEIDISTGFVADKATAGSGGCVSGSNKLQRTESLPYKMMTMHHNLPLPSSGWSQNKNGAEDEDVGAVAGGGVGPISHNGIYKEEEGEGGGGGGDWGSATRTVPSFSTNAFESPGVMAPYLGFPFTSAQWQELERQALIYKYMMASTPVPPNLLMSICRNLSDTVAASPHSALVARSSCFNLRFSSGMDPEPGRCRRTDGKKWRCAIYVAPDQKYCEKHLHRGRPRSRKPVEQHQLAEIKKHEGNNMRSAPLTPQTASPYFPNITTNTTTTTDQLSGLLSRTDFKASPFDNLAPLPSYKEPRSVDWMMRGEAVPLAASNQHWAQKAQLKTNFAAFRQPYEAELSLETYSNFGGGEGSGARHQNDKGFLFLNPEITSLCEPSSPEHRHTPRRFIHAWSSPARNSTRNEGNKFSICSDGKLSPSALTLSMSGGNFSNEDKDQIQMGLGVIGSWIPSPPGGPLAEVLRPSSAGSESHGCCGGGKSSSYCCGGLNFNLVSGDWGTSGDSPIATTASSPSEMLQQTMASVSDSSGSSSSTFKVGAAKSEMAFQWLNQGK